MDLWLLPSAATLAGLELAEFELRTRRADVLPAIEPGLDSALRQAFSWTSSPPWAALLAGADSHSPTPWLAADLVNVRAELRSARIMALAIDQPPDDADLPLLFDALRPWLADEAIEIASIQGGRALLRCPISHGDPAVAAPDALLGCDLREALPVDLRWQRRINELQIVLAQQSCNAVRAARSLPVWNTLWFWGQGSADSCPALPLKAVASNDPMLTALARAQGIAVLASPSTAAAAVLRDLRDPRQLLQAWSSGLRPVDALLRCADGSGWRMRPWQALRLWR